MQSYTPNTIDQNTQVLANYLPNDKPFEAKNITDSNLRKLLKSISYEYTRLQEKAFEMVTQDDLSTTTNLLVAWETALGIPDSFFSNTAPIATRRLQIVAKFAKMNLTTEQDWIDLAAFFGIEIEIEHGSGTLSRSEFPMIFPAYFVTSDKEAKFTMFVTFLNLVEPTNVFPAIFPVQFQNDANFLICVFNYCKPANVHVVYLYG